MESTINTSAEEIQPLATIPPSAGSTLSMQSFETETDYIAKRDDEENYAYQSSYNDEQQQQSTSTNKVSYHDPVSPDYTIYATILPYFVLERIFPPHVPRSVQLLRKENLAIPMCYLVVGILQGLSGPFINVYPLFLGATEAQQTTISSIKRFVCALLTNF